MESEDMEVDGPATHTYLVGPCLPQIIGNKLPSNRQVLSVLFFNLRMLKLPLTQSSSIVAQEVLVFWEKASLPTKQAVKIGLKVKGLYTTLRNVQESASRSVSHTRDQFIDNLDNLFDIAHANILEMIDENRKDFLINQRKEGIVGYIGDVEFNYTVSEYEKNQEIIQRRKQRESEVQERIRRSEQEKLQLDDCVQLQSSESQSSRSLSQNSVTYSDIILDQLDDESDYEPSAKRSRGSTNVVTVEIVSVLDRYRISNRAATELVCAFAKYMKLDLNSIIMNRSSILRCREKLRKAQAARIKEVFQTTDLNTLVIHWDGKMMRSVHKHEKEERLTIVATNGSLEQILHIPAIKDSTGKMQADALYEVTSDWGLLDKIKVLCSDTTASNTGSTNGAVFLFQKMLNREILYFPCRHHIFEVVLRAIFELEFPQVSGPDVLLFKRFQEKWPELDKNLYSAGIDDPYLEKILRDDAHLINEFVIKNLERPTVRDDYKELLELTQIFLGFIPKAGISFKFPGAHHHARWMSKAIYSLKIFLFRNHFDLSKKDERGLAEVCLFIVKIYVAEWFMAPIAYAAPNRDLNFLKILDKYESVNPKVSKEAIRKFRNHLWYLAPEPAALAFFDTNISVEIKRKMVEKLQINENVNVEWQKKDKRFLLNPKNQDAVFKADIDYFINAESLNFFGRFDISKEFLILDPSLWEKNESYISGLSIIKKLKVVNDCAERAVQLMAKYQNHLSHNEEQKQYVISMMAEFTKGRRDSRKRDIIV